MYNRVTQPLTGGCCGYAHKSGIIHQLQQKYLVIGHNFCYAILGTDEET
jgi:hypothetical protein